MRSPWICFVLIPMTNILIREENTHKDTQGSMTCEDGSRDRSDGAESQTMPWMTENHQKLEETSKGFPLSLQGIHKPANTSILDFWPPKLQENKFLLLIHQFGGHFYASSRKQNVKQSEQRHHQLYTKERENECHRIVPDTLLNKPQQQARTTIFKRKKSKFRIIAALIHDLKCSVFQQKVKRYINKQERMTHIQRGEKAIKPTPRNLLKRNESRFLHKKLYLYIHNSMIYNSPQSGNNTNVHQLGMDE